jgi:hypothetical protein
MADAELPMEQSPHPPSRTHRPRRDAGRGPARRRLVASELKKHPVPRSLLEIDFRWVPSEDIEVVVMQCEYFREAIRLVRERLVRQGLDPNLLWRLDDDWLGLLCTGKGANPDWPPFFKEMLHVVARLRRHVHCDIDQIPPSLDILPVLERVMLELKSDQSIEVIWSNEKELGDWRLFNPHRRSLEIFMPRASVGAINKKEVIRKVLQFLDASETVAKMSGGRHSHSLLHLAFLRYSIGRLEGKDYATFRGFLGEPSASATEYGVNLMGGRAYNPAPSYWSSSISKAQKRIMEAADAFFRLVTDSSNPDEQK